MEVTKCPFGQKLYILYLERLKWKVVCLLKKKKKRNSAMELHQAATMEWLLFPFVLLLQHAWEKGTASQNCSWENSSSYGENPDFFSEAQE